MERRRLARPLPALPAMILTSLAYLGPGGILGSLGSALALIGAIVMAVFGFLWYPMKRWLRARKARQQSDTEEASV